MGGTFQTSREIFEHPIWKNILEFRLFFLIYGNAVFHKEGYRVSEDLHLERGQWLRSTRKLQEDLEYIENRQKIRYSTSQINRAIKSLSHVNVQMLRTKTHQLGTVFTVVNYEKYQGFMPTRKQELGTELGTDLERTWNNNKKDQEGFNAVDDDRAHALREVENAFCQIHAIGNWAVKAKDIECMQKMIAGGTPSPFIIATMSEVHTERTNAGEKISTFRYYENPIKQAWEKEQAKRKVVNHVNRGSPERNSDVYTRLSL